MNLIQTQSILLYIFLLLQSSVAQANHSSANKEPYVVLERLTEILNHPDTSGGKESFETTNTIISVSNTNHGQVGCGRPSRGRGSCRGRRQKMANTKVVKVQKNSVSII